MKKTSVVRANIKPLPAKNSNMKHCQGDQERNVEMCLTESDCMVESQAQIIENLQQQIYVLENETSYLRTHILENNKQHPSMVAEGEKMVKKLAECHNEMQIMKVEIKRKQTSIDMMRSERDRIQRYKEELEEKFRKEKCRLLEEVITARKDKESLQDNNIEIERLLQEQKQNERNLQKDLDNLRVEMEQIKREKEHDKDLLSNILQKKEKLQKEVTEMKMAAEAKSSEMGAEAIKELKEKIEELHLLCDTSKRSADHERLLRERLSEDNTELIKRHAELESELAEARALLREEQSLRSSLEKVHLATILEASEAKNRDDTLKDEISHLNDLLKKESERAYNLSLQLSDEQCFKSREEEKYSHLHQRFEQREEQMKVRENENMELLRDNTYLKDQTMHLKEQLKNRDEEVINLKQKVQEMQVSVEEFIQSTQAANRLAGERWKQLGQLAQGITALTSIAEPDS